MPSPRITMPAWLRSADINGNRITFIGQAGLAVYAGSRVEEGLIFAAGRVSPPQQPSNQYKLFAFSRVDGSVRWQTPIARPVSDSNSSPAIDEQNQTVIYASGDRVQAFRIDTGEAVWQSQLENPIVNASPVITPDLNPADRLFITDYVPYTTPDRSRARLYCINVDVFDPDRNPFQPGDIVWSVPIERCSGASPSYLPRGLHGDSLVFVASFAELCGPPPDSDQRPRPGHIFAFPVADQASPPVWIFENEIDEGFFGGVCVSPPSRDSPPGTPPALYAATYSYYGATDSANLVKLDARTGRQIWSVRSNRTNSIPVPLPGGFIALSAGVPGYGSRPNLQVFEDLGITSRLVWDTSPLTSVFGGWTHQPVAMLFGGRNVLAVGAPPAELLGRSPRLFLIDLASSDPPGDIVLDEFAGAGGSPAVVGSNLYSVGTAGLVAFGPTPAGLDVNGDGVESVDDLYSWERGEGARDVNADGVVDDADRAALITSLRAPQPCSMSWRRE